MIPRRQLGKIGLSVSLLGYGGAPIGFTNPERQAGFTHLIQAAIDAGINFFDTAANYRESEALLGHALGARRKEVIIATKCGRIQKRREDGWEDAEDWSEEGVVRSVEASLRDLRTDYIDLVQLHSPPRWALEDGAAVAGLQKTQREGKVRYIGVSADGPDALLAIELGVFATLQTSYSILEQEPGDTLIPAAEAGMGVIVKQPIANGIAAMTERPLHPDWSRKWDISSRMDWAALCGHFALRIPHSALRLALALRWVLSNPLISTAIVGTTNIEHLQENIAVAQSLLLDTTEFERICGMYREATGS